MANFGLPSALTMLIEPDAKTQNTIPIEMMRP
jgi:hypothetical protein